MVRGGGKSWREREEEGGGLKRVEGGMAREEVWWVRGWGVGRGRRRNQEDTSWDTARSKPNRNIEKY
jgi:hypothetical protein